MSIPLLGTLGTFSIVVLFFVLAKLSERFGSVIRMTPIYKYYYIAILLVAISFVTHFFVARAISTAEPPAGWLLSSWFLIAAYYLPLAGGSTVALVITWRYWSWLITEGD